MQPIHDLGEAQDDKNPNLPKTILLVDDNPVSRLISKWFLSNFGYVVHALASAENALVAFDPKLHDLVMTDNGMPGINGEEMAHIIKMRSPKTPVLMYTGNPPTNTNCIDMVILKPAELPTLKKSVEELFLRSSARRNANLSK